jgi:hypothetical protein
MLCYFAEGSWRRWLHAKVMISSIAGISACYGALLAVTALFEHQPRRSRTPLVCDPAHQRPHSPYYMHKSPLEFSPNRSKNKAAHPDNRKLTQHGNPPSQSLFSLLLELPPESLAHVTANLEPPELLALARTNRYLYEHVTEDNTWYRAFLYQLMGVNPEGSLHEVSTLTLRRRETSWRKEFISRYRTQR